MIIDLDNQDKLLAVVYTAYRPDAFLVNRIAPIKNVCDHVFIIDNTPGGHDFNQVGFTGVTILQDGVNKGLGRAINIGIDAARSAGCNYVVLFDQDSTPNADLLSNLLSAVISLGPLAIIAPKLVDDAIDVIPKKTRGRKSDDDINAVVIEMTSLATSGMCFKIPAASTATEFCSDFFLDFVDFDWCWRMQRQGYKVYLLESLVMHHRLGLKQIRFGPLKFHVPAPFRHYFQFRDGLKLLFRPSVPLYSRFRFSIVVIPKILIYPFILDRGMHRLKWMLLGLRDAFFNVKGIGAARTSLTKTDDQIKKMH